MLTKIREVFFNEEKKIIMNNGEWRIH